jgi:pyruvate dehydrogenase E1 component
VIVDHGMRAMLEEGRDEFYYLTVMNENYSQPSMPEHAQADIVKGLYRFTGSAAGKGAPSVRLVGSGAILPEVIEAGKMLERDWGLPYEVWSATSYSELARDAREVERRNRLNPLGEEAVSHVSGCLAGKTPVIAASDYVRAYPQLIASYLEAPLTVLGTDGFGRSDSRSALRTFFEVDRRQVAVAALSALARSGKIDRKKVAQAISQYGVAANAPSPWSI